MFDVTAPYILNESTVERKWFQISALTGLDIKNPKYSENQPLHILRAMLRHAVSENNAHRQEYILQISTAGNTRNILAGIIQQTKQASCMSRDDVSGVSSGSKCDDDDHNDVENVIQMRKKFNTTGRPFFKIKNNLVRNYKSTSTKY
mmetsp:Transcript_10594/g.12097  ORF Transcript_10594/g.12097 Transcript_10594/m.12097 type:complete len:147 (+) Transcript_10594:310-750(+)